MFHVYFGAFDFVVYAIAVFFAIYMGNALCDEMEERDRLKNQTGKEVARTQPAHDTASPQGKGAQDRPLILDAQLYELRGQLVIRKDELPVSVPSGVKTYTLRGDPAIRLSDLQQVFDTVAIDAGQVIHKWEQWSKPKKKPRKRHRNPVKEAAALNGGARHGAASTLPV